MDHYLVSARKYRPATFDSVVGQKALTATLKNAIATNRLAHSYLFCGSRGVGKTSCARIFAKTINCEHPTADGEACNECESCRSFNAGNSLNIIEMDAASNNGVDSMRELVDQVMVAPATGRYRVFIIDEVHMLSNAAFNAFLKTLEEPPAHVIFILATTEKHKIIPTILSRCQIYDFNTISIQDITDHLAHVASLEGIEAEPAALGVIARKADGAMRDALSIFDQVAASTRGHITYQATLDNLNVLGDELYMRLTETFLAGDVMGSWLIYKEVRSRGFDSHFFLTGLADYMRDLMVAREPRTRSLLDADEATAQALTSEAQKCDPDFIYRAMCLLNDADLNYRTASNKQFLVELTLAKICQLLRPRSTKSGQPEGQLKPIDRPKQAPDAGRPAAQSATPAPSSSRMAPTQPTAPQSRPAPTITPTITPVSPSQPGGRGGGATPPAMPSLRVNLATGPTLRGGFGHKEAAAPSSRDAGPKRTTPYTQEQIQAAWEAYMAAHPKEQILTNTMRASSPQTVGENCLGISVENDIQLRILTDNLQQLTASLRNAVSNDLVTLEITVNDGPGSAMTWNEREVLEKMVENNPKLTDLIRDFHLSLG